MLSVFKSVKVNTTTVLALGVVTVLVGAAALNGGTAPTASAWDGLKTTLQDMLTSSWVLALAFIALVAAVWQLAHGKGYAYLATVLGLLSVALIGPTFVTSVATATRAPVAISQPAAAPAVLGAN